MGRLLPRPLKVEQDFTDVRLVGFEGCSALALTAERLELFKDLSEGVHIKVRRRGASDGEPLWALVASLAAGGGSLSDLDGLRSDPAGLRLLGLSHALSGHRMGEFSAKVSESDVDGLLEAARRLARRVAPAVIEHEVEARGFVPVFVDGTETEVGGELFEGTDAAATPSGPRCCTRCSRRPVGVGLSSSGRGRCGARLAGADGVGRRSPAAQGELFPVHTVIFVSRDDPPLTELVRRHRDKQG